MPILDISTIPSSLIYQVTQLAAEGRDGMTAQSNPPGPLLRANNVNKRFGKRTVLRDQSLEVMAGEAVAIVGENGAGKSTLLRVLAGVLAQDSGSVQMVGPPGYCPQQPGLLDLLTVDDHFALFGAGFGLAPADALQAGRSLLHSLGYRSEPDRRAKFMSGGNRQKLNLALALLGDPDVLLLDEPYQGFDFGTYVNFWDNADGWRRAGKAIVIVTHMLAELERVDRIIELRWADPQVTNARAA
jgi:ABC-2 type transport system ATP-binding protein